AGHGEAFGGRSYLVPIDGVPHVAEPCLPVAELLQLLARIPARLRLVVLDVCRGGQVMGPRHALPIAFENELKGARDALVFSACNTDEQSYEDDRLPGGVFTHFWSKGLTSQPPSPRCSISAFDVFRYAKDGVQEWLSDNPGLPPQTPSWWG